MKNRIPRVLVKGRRNYGIKYDLPVLRGKRLHAIGKLGIGFDSPKTDSSLT